MSGRAIGVDTLGDWPRPDLRAQTLTAALGLRPALAPLVPVIPTRPVVAFSRTVDQLYHLLVDLEPAEWMTLTNTVYGRVRHVVAHLAGVESVALSWIGQGPAIEPAVAKDHAAATAPTMAALADAPVEVVLARWRDGTARLVAACRGIDPHRPVVAHDVSTDVDGMLVMRTFEVWSHLDDICRAVGRPRPALDAGRLALLSQRLVQVLPFVVAQSGVAIPHTAVRLVLTGDGGGSYIVSFTAAVPTAVAALPPVAVRIVADATGFCRYAARRIGRSELDASIEGDAGIADLVLSATRAFARD